MIMATNYGWNHQREFAKIMAQISPLEFCCMSDNHLVLDELHGPANAAQRRGREQARRNWDWLQAHWCELLPNAHGKFVAVADEQAFIADSLDAALAWIRAEHPDDDGHIVEYVLPQSGPRIYLVVPC